MARNTNNINTSSMSVVKASHEGSRIENKFSLKSIYSNSDKTTLDGNFPLQPFRKGARGTYGGELVCQAINAAWETVEDKEFSPHLIHSYFVKAGTSDLVMRWEVQQVSNTRNYANRLVQGYQGEGGRLVYVLQVSFTKANQYSKRLEEAEQAADATVQSGGIPRSLPIRFQAKPNSFFDKYREKLDELSYLEHTHGLLQHIALPEFYSGKDETFDFKSAGSKELGFFFRVNDDWRAAKNPRITKYLQLAYASDSAYLGSVLGALGIKLPVSKDDPLFSFFRVSLDHNIYFHDEEFDTNEWLFLDYHFSNLNNDRVLCQCEVYTLDGRMVATIIQEGLVYFTEEILNRVKNTNLQLSSKL